jgi:hypothetical protein
MNCAKRDEDVNTGYDLCSLITIPPFFLDYVPKIKEV